MDEGGVGFPNATHFAGGSCAPGGGRVAGCDTSTGGARFSTIVTALSPTAGTSILLAGLRKNSRPSSALRSMCFAGVKMGWGPAPPGLSPGLASAYMKWDDVDIVAGANNFHPRRRRPTARSPRRSSASVTTA